MTHNKNKPVDKRLIKLQGQVTKVLSSRFYNVKIVLENGTTIEKVAYHAGKITNNKIKILEGDIVDVEIDTNSKEGQGRIVYRHK